ncbi:MAG: site-specific integrase [Bifidobacteriaceae bacterium]|jgi:integrase|nr:site-specific integrase [Bifidobacteriaceae bacterium]
MRNTTRKIETLPTGSFRVRVYRDEQYRSRTFKTLAEAEHFNQQINQIGVDAAIADLHAKKALNKRNKRKRQITLCDYMLVHANELANVNDEYRRFIRTVARSLGVAGDIQVCDIETDNIKSIISLFEKAGNSPKTVQNKYMAIASVIRKAHNLGLVQSNPCYGIRLPKVRQKQMQTLEPDEIKVFIEIMHPHYQPFTQTLFRTGLRFGEITALEVQDFNPNQHTLSINKAWSDSGKRIAPPKTERSNRTIPLPKDVCDILTNLCKGKKRGDLIFLTVNGMRIRNDAYRTAWLKALSILNGDRTNRPAHISPERFEELPIIDKHLRIHDARHTYASTLINGGVALATVSDFLGHSNYETTAKRYGHLQLAGRKAVISALGDAP